jgi:hypothetical protein
MSSVGSGTSTRVEHGVEHGVDELVLALKVRVQRRRLDIERSCEASHREGVATIVVENSQGLRQRSLRASGPGARFDPPSQSPTSLHPLTARPCSPLRS